MVTLVKEAGIPDWGGRLVTQLQALLRESAPVSISASLGGVLTTGNATATTIGSYALPGNSTALITANIVGVRTGGSAGNVSDSMGAQLTGLVKNINGNLTIVSQALAYIAHDQSAWTAALVTSGTVVHVQVTGAGNNTIDWRCMGSAMGIS